MNVEEVSQVYCGGGAELTAADKREYARLLRELDGVECSGGAATAAGLAVVVAAAAGSAALGSAAVGTPTAPVRWRAVRARRDAEVDGELRAARAWRARERDGRLPLSRCGAWRAPAHRGA